MWQFATPFFNAPLAQLVEHRSPKSMVWVRVLHGVPDSGENMLQFLLCLFGFHGATEIDHTVDDEEVKVCRDCGKVKSKLS